jgi:galactokinase/mevalonate kinase-like predicted kinase
VINKPWDYLILTASNEDQGTAYESQLKLRKKLGLVPDVKEVMVIPDPGSRRVGSGGSTIWCLLRILSRELRGSSRILDRTAWLETLSRLRILIVHAGGDARRLPAYGACGKAFIPVPGESDRVLGMTLFDRQLPVYIDLPDGPPSQGQVIVTSGDVLLTFDSRKVRFSEEGITGLGCYAEPELAKNHGVFCPEADGRVRLFLQKPTPREQAEKGAVNRHGKAILDIGVTGFSARTALELIEICEVSKADNGELTWTGTMGHAIEDCGLDLYREISCAMGTEIDFGQYVQSVRRSGSALKEAFLRKIFETMCRVRFSVGLLPKCGFLHFGTARQLIQSGNDLLSIDYGTSRADSCLQMNNDVAADGQIAGADSWVEGCRIRSALTLGGENVIVGVDVSAPLSLPARSVVDILQGKDRKGRAVWFVRCYGIDDLFHKPVKSGARLAGIALGDWLRVMDASEEDIWDIELPPEERQVWNARVFPAVGAPEDYRNWVWMIDPGSAGRDEKRSWRVSDRYSFAEMSALASHEDFHRRRLENRMNDVKRTLGRMFRPESGFSAAELAFILDSVNEPERGQWIAEILRESAAYLGGGRSAAGLEQLELSRILHSLGSAIQKLENVGEEELKRMPARIYDELTDPEKASLASIGLSPDPADDAVVWTDSLKRAAFENVSRTIVYSRERHPEYPKCALRTDEIVWGRAPARLDLGGGWSDTPPYALEHGGCVINAAVDLNGQPPIHAYVRVIEEPEIRIGSIDHGARLVIKELDELLDYRSPESKFGLGKATLALCGFSPASEGWPPGARTLEEMLRLFGGGIELTTLAAIPSGSGLGTSSIMGAVLMAVVHRMIGRSLSPRELFHNVLRLEQELTTGGGWQDQVGGVLGGVKMITTDPGLVPDPRIHYVSSDVLDPGANNGQTLLYYTGLRRLAKNILQYVVGNYLDRDRAAMDTLRKIHSFPPLLVEAMAEKDLKQFGELIDVGWELKKRLDPDSTNDLIEEILERIRPHVHGATVLGAGGGGFLLIVSKSPEDAHAVKTELEKNPPNRRARFFDFRISREGLVVTVC